MDYPDARQSANEPWRPFFLRTYYLERAPPSRHLTRVAREELLVRSVSRERVRNFRPSIDRPFCLPLVVDSSSLRVVHVGPVSTFPDGLAEQILNNDLHIIMYEFSVKAQAPKIRRRPSPSNNSIRRRRRVIEHVDLTLTCSVSTAKGLRRSNEDRHSVFFDAAESLVFSAPGSESLDAAFVGVFDGHAGSEASELVSLHLQNQFREALARQSITEDDETYGTIFNKRPAIRKALEIAFERTESEVERAAVEERWHSGTTAVCAVVDNCLGRRTLTVANLGDSRCVGCDFDGLHFEVTKDQTPSSPSERERIIQEGGVVDEYGYVNGMISVSRAMGDIDESTGKKILGLSALPKLCAMDVEGKCEFFILGCDGLWDVVSSQRAVDLVREVFVTNRRCACDEASAALVKESLANHTTDNVTALVVSLVADEHWERLWSERTSAVSNDSSDGGGSTKVVDGFVFRGRPSLNLRVPSGARRDDVTITR